MDHHDMECRCCKAMGSDVRMVPCGCTMHAKCTPIQLFLGTNGLGSMDVRRPGQMACSFCNTTIQSVYILPMTTELLDTAAAEKRKHVSSPADEESRVDESPYLLLTTTTTSSSSSTCIHRDYRTGRFSDEEMDFCEFLMTNFDRGVLPMGAGIRLNDFLCTMLLCKPSRLTKKMKNAKLGSRTYELLSQDPNRIDTVEPLLNFELFHRLQERFLQSVTSVAVRCELRFHMEKMWRSNLSSLCVQIGSKLLDATDWISNLEEMEQRGALAEESIRKARRRRMGLALKTDVGAQPGVFFSGVPVQPPTVVQSSSPSSALLLVPPPALAPKLASSGESFHTITSTESARTHHISNMLDIDESKPRANSSTANYNLACDDTVDDDFANFFDDLIEDKPFSCGLSMGSNSVRHTSGSFLEEVIAYLERNHLPFQHVDVWVPSYHPSSVQRTPQDLRLFHSGHGTRTDVDAIVTSQLMEYGEYSTKFSFATGVGLPGRVFKSGESSWECRLDLADPKLFERAGGAGVYGVKTGVGIPMSSSLVGRLVLCLYSLDDLEMDADMLRKLEQDLSKYCPKPTWKLVVEVDSESMSSSKSIPPPAVGLGPTTPSAGRERRSDSMSVHSTLSNRSQSPNTNTQRGLEIEIAKILTDFLPGANLPGAMTETDDGLLPFYMSLRLLLLRDPDRRTEEENIKLDVIRKSYEGFTGSYGSRTKRDIADLIVRDWRFLKTAGEHKPAAGSGSGHLSMMMNEPKVQTFAPSGAPARVPFALGDPNETRNNNKKRRILTLGQVNIVDDHSF